MFTAENFRRIFDNENRKGIDIASRFFPDLEEYTLSVRDKMKEIRDLRAKETTLSIEEFIAKIASLKAELAVRKSEKSNAIDDLMDTMSLKVLKDSFKLGLTKRTGPQGKPIFCIDGTPETFFVIKQLQHNINKIYGVKQANRHDLVCQLRDTVRSRFPFEIVRTDISSFYESIDRKRLLKKLDTDQLLSSSSKKYIKQILDSYGDIAQSPTGVPRGVGISAYLAELYLRPIDQKIKRISGIVLYCRYVDDIVAIFARPPSGKSQGSYKDSILKALSDEGLTYNAAKTSEFNMGEASEKNFEYLGYRFTLKFGECSIFPSQAKIEKYTTRISAAFNAYSKQSSLSSRRAYRDLISRVKFLTGNTRLSNSKSSAVTGIYYNNSLVNDLSGFKQLDKVLKTKVKGIKRPSLRKQLLLHTFTDGFSNRRFHNFSAAELQMIVGVWKHG